MSGILCVSCDRRVPGRTVDDFEAHYTAVHFNVPVTGHTPQSWEAAAVQLLREAARTGQAFTVAEALAPIGDHPDPERRQFVTGPIVSRLASEGVIQHAEQAATQSLKPTSNASLVRVWIGTTERTAAA